MKRKIIKREAAKRDLIEIADYIARDSIRAADRFVDASEDAFRFLLKYPGAGSPRFDLNPGFASLRAWAIRKFEKYLIFYRQVPEGIEIIRVLHSARDIDSIMRDKPT